METCFLLLMLSLLLLLLLLLLLQNYSLLYSFPDSFDRENIKHTASTLLF